MAGSPHPLLFIYEARWIITLYKGLQCPMPHCHAPQLQGFQPRAPCGQALHIWVLLPQEHTPSQQLPFLVLLKWLKTGFKPLFTLSVFVSASLPLGQNRD